MSWTAVVRANARCSKRGWSDGECENETRGQGDRVRMRFVAVSCDECGEEFHKQTAARADHDARAAGWLVDKRVNGVRYDLCPECRKKGAGPWRR